MVEVPTPRAEVTKSLSGIDGSILVLFGAAKLSSTARRSRNLPWSLSAGIEDMSVRLVR